MSDSVGGAGSASSSSGASASAAASSNSSSSPSSSPSNSTNSSPASSPNASPATASSVGAGPTQAESLSAAPSPSRSLTDAATPSQSLTRGPTQAETLAQAATPAQALASSPTTAEQLAQAPTPIDQLSPSAPAPETPQLGNIPPRPDLTGPTPGITSMTPGATYLDGVTPQEVTEKLQYQDGYARYQWATGQGVVGPVGQEKEGIYAGYNNPADPNFAKYQQFGYHHDMQATDAQLQSGFAYNVTLATSALRGMDVLQATGDVDRGLDAARREWRSSGFDVRTRY
jgi:hypothetical protein